MLLGCASHKLYKKENDRGLHLTTVEIILPWHHRVSDNLWIVHGRNTAGNIPYCGYSAVNCGLDRTASSQRVVLCSCQSRPKNWRGHCIADCTALAARPPKTFVVYTYAPLILPFVIFFNQFAFFCPSVTGHSGADSGTLGCRRF